MNTTVLQSGTAEKDGDFQLKEYRHRCDTCGKYFVWHSPNCKYCSEDCRAVGKRQKDQIRHKKAYTPITVHDFTCVDCGKKFRVFGSTKSRKHCDACLLKQCPSRLAYRKDLVEETINE